MPWAAVRICSTSLAIHHSVIKIGADALLHQLELVTAPLGRPLCRHQLIATAGDAVINQIRHLAEGVEVEAELGLRQLLLQVFDGVRHWRHRAAAARPTWPAPLASSESKSWMATESLLSTMAG